MFLSHNKNIQRIILTFMLRQVFDIVHCHSSTEEFFGKDLGQRYLNVCLMCFQNLF